MTVNGSRIAVRRPGARRRRRRLPARDVPRPTADSVWALLETRPAAERPAVLQAQLGRLPADEVARLLALSEAAARRAVLARLAGRDGAER